MGMGISRYQSPFLNKAYEFQGRAAQSFAAMQRREKSTTTSTSKGGGGGMGSVLGAAFGVAGTIAGAAIGGAPGAMIGGSIGNLIGSLFGGGTAPTGMTTNDTSYVGGKAPEGSKYFNSEKGGGSFSDSITTYFI